MDVIIAFVMAWICTLSGVALGGFLVFKTKREHYEGLFTGEQKGDSFNVLDDYSDFSGEARSSAKIPPEVEAANNAFVDQFANNLATKVSE